MIILLCGDFVVKYFTEVKLSVFVMEIKDLEAIDSKCGCNKLAPKAQLKPILSNGKCETEIRKASAV